MGERVFAPCDGAALERLLARHDGDRAGVVLRLAWRAGLTRDEIVSLRWEQVDFGASALRLGARDVPLEPETVDCLLRYRAALLRSEPRVVPLAPQSVSRLARRALDEEGLIDVRLLDLRLDFVRRLLQTHDWPYVLRVSGFSLTTYRLALSRLRGASAPAAPPAALVDADRLAAVMDAEGASAAGVALRLACDLGARAGELAALTWDAVDLDAGTLRLGHGVVALTEASRAVLSRALAARSPGDDPHVLLSPRARRPLDAPRLSTLVLDALIRGGAEGLSLSDARFGAERALSRQVLLDHARENGSITRADAARLLGCSGAEAYARLRELTEAGALARIGARCFPADAVVPPERHAETIRAYLEQYGAAYRQDVAELLRVPPRTAARILAGLVEAGALNCDSRTRRYTLPEE